MFKKTDDIEHIAVLCHVVLCVTWMLLGYKLVAIIHRVSKKRRQLCQKRRQCYFFNNSV